MKKFDSVKVVLAFLLTLFISSSCDDLDAPKSSDKSRVEKGLIQNAKQVADFSYKYVKYYNGTLDYKEFVPEKLRAKYFEELDRLTALYDKNKWTPIESVAYLTEQGYYSKAQANVWLTQHKKLLDFITGQPSLAEFKEWSEERDLEIAQDLSMTFKEKAKVLNERAAINSLIAYKIEIIPDAEKMSGASIDVQNARVNACGFWEKLGCWAGYVSGITGVSGLASDLAGLFVAASSSVATYITGVGAAIGVVVGTIRAVNGCDCNMNYCGVAEGINFNYQCYTPGSDLLYQVWGYGNVTPSQFEFQFYKNNDLSVNGNFWGNFTPNNGIDYLSIPGSEITNDNVQSVAVRSIVYCSGTPFTQTFGWYNLSDLGKPFFLIDGPSTISQPNGYYEYSANGPIRIAPNTTIQWEIIPSNYPGYSASGTIAGGFGSNSPGIFVNWNTTPGIAFVKCTATSPCATIVSTYTVTIQ